MIKASRLLALGTFLGVVAAASSPLLGEPEKSTGGPGPIGASRQLPRSEPAAGTGAAEETVAARFAERSVLTYQPLKGDAVFALQLQPKLPAVSARPRDYLIMVSTSAVMAGAPRTAALQIAEAILETAGEHDRVALWTANDPEATRCLSEEFRAPKERPDALMLKKALATLRDKETPLGAVDLKTALERAIKSYDGGASRQRILLFLGDGQSTYNPLSAAARGALASEMVKRRVAFFPVPLGLQLEPANLHGLASATGGVVLRTRVAEEKLADALKRYQEAFAGAILYEPRFTKLPATVGETFPRQLPPLRGDCPTLVVGRLKDIGKSFDFDLTGIPAGQTAEITVAGTEELKAPDLDNYFLFGLAEQWRQAKEQPALLRADRALTFAHEQTKLQHQELLLSAEVAVENSQLEAAGRLFERVRQLAPHDGEAKAGLRVIEKLKSGALTKDALRAQLDRHRHLAETLDKVGGKVHVRKLDLVQLAQLEREEKAPAKAAPAAVEREDLLQAQRDRIILEEQRLSQLAEEALRQARRDLTETPEAALDVLRGALERVRENPDLREATRDALTARLQASLRATAAQARLGALRLQQRQHNTAVLADELRRGQQQQTFQERIESQFNIFKSQMGIARVEEAAKQAVIYGMFGIAQEARQRGMPVPVASQAGYDIALAGYHLQKNSELRRLREERFLSVMLSVEKSFVPFSDEPGIYFPPLATWKAIRDARKEKYEVTSLPDDEKGRKAAMHIYKLLQEPIETKDFTTPMTLKDALGLLYERFAAQGKELPILVDTAAFKEDAAEAPDPYEATVSLPPVPRKLSIATALRLMLSKIPTNNATYLIRRDFIEITTNDRMIKDKVLRVFPVGDLVIPISMMGGMGMMGMRGGMMGMRGGMMGGGMMGMMGGGMMGMRGGMMGGGMMGMGGGMMGMMGGMGGMGMGGMGMMGMGGMQMMGMGGMGMRGGMMGMGGGMMGMMGGMGMGGMGMMGMRGGMMGMGGGMMGGMGMMGMSGSMVGGSFQGGFNGSLGMMGATQAIGLIQLITKVVAPGEWFLTQQPSPLAPMLFPGLGMVGALGGGMGMLGMVGGGPPPAPVEQGGPADIQQANTIEFFPPSLALIVRAPSRIHTSITGGIIGGKSKRADAAAMVERRGIAVAAAGPPPKRNGAAVGGAVQVAKAQLKAGAKKTLVELDPAKVWQDALSKEDVQPGLVIATADFLFESGKFAHAAEFLKASLRRGVVVRPWVYEALAVALEASGGSAEEIRRARLSAAALDPKDAQGFLNAARAMSEHKQWERALAFCRQAALLEPNLAQPYEEALVLAELGQDSKAMAWAASKLVSQDWPADNLILHKKAQLRVEALAGTLQRAQRGAEADHLKEALGRSNRRDVVIALNWDCGSELAELEMTVKEPCGSVSSPEQRQTPGGGAMNTSGLTEPRPSATYTAAEALSGEYEVKVRRLWGRPLGDRARLEITLHKGTPQERRRLEIVRLDKANTFKLTLQEGRRTELAQVPPPSAPRRRPNETGQPQRTAGSALLKLRDLAHADLSGATGPRGAACTRGAASPTAPRPPQAQRTVYQTGVASLSGAGMNLTAELKMSADRREVNLVMQPVYQALAGNRQQVNLSAIPGGVGP
jgi:tetratricopeptide (TPR) repeat protein